MKGSYPTNRVYDHFSENWENVEGYVKTPWKQSESKNSLSFTNDTKLVKKRLEEYFQVNFTDKYDKAVRGYEKKRIATLHSSSLLALICFHRVSKDSPLVITINDVDCEFTKVFFEVKNSIKNGNPSNMDVVLSGKYKNEEKPVLLYLESKFTEYLTTGNKTKIRQSVYKETYQKIFTNDKLVISTDDNISAEDYSQKYKDEENTEWIKLIGKKHYCEGIKQMISHYMGLRDTLDTQEFKKDNELHDLMEQNPDIYLGSIIYDCADWEEVADYKECYKAIAQKLNELGETDKFKVLPELLTYQEVFKGGNADILTEKIKEYYKLVESK